MLFREMLVNILNVGYRSTNYYVLADSQPRLLVDAGWAGTLPQFQHQFKRVGIRLSDVKHVLCTHYHPDHAGLAQALKRLGCTLVVVDIQLLAIPLLKGQVKPSDHDVEIDLKDNLVVSLADSRALLKRIGIDGEIVATPGHSDDSVSLVLDSGEAFTGDLTHPSMADDVARASWAALREKGAKTVYPGHGHTGQPIPKAL
jgi:glyoxylase-like metal-dependent hydrolase (beta-lactamase superfamily II)